MTKFDHQSFGWSPQSGPQDDLLTCPLQEIFFGGARGGGKTDGVLGKWAAKEREHKQHFNAIMFRRTAVSAEDAVERSREIYRPLGGRFNESKLRWRMPNGGRVSFAYLDTVADANVYQGRNVTDAWVEEAGQYPSPAAIDRLFGILRSSHGVPIQLILTANPGGPGQHWIRERYHIHPFPLQPVIMIRTLPNGKEHRVAVIPSRITDNKILLANDPGYVDRLQLVGSPQLVRAWLEGDWSAIEGAFFTEWDEQKHVIAPFAIPPAWMRFRSADWGSFSPFSIGWWAVATDDYPIGGAALSERGAVPGAGTDLLGTELLKSIDEHKTRKVLAGGGRIIPRGALVHYREWYGEVGGKLTADEVGNGIVEREKLDRPRLSYGVLDPSAFAESGGPSIAERINKVLIDGKMAAFRPADNKRVARTTGDPTKSGPMGGWDQMRARLKGSDGVPMLYVFEACKNFIRTVPVLQHDETRTEDVDTESEDHCFAAGTLVETYNGRVPIEHLDKSGWVISWGGGYEEYRSPRMTRKNAEVVRLTFTNGTVVTCTRDHKFLVDFDKWRYAQDLQDVEVTCARPLSLRQFRISTAHDIISAANTFSAKVSAFTLWFGNFITARFQKVIISTIRTMIALITLSTIWSASLSRSTSAKGMDKKAVSVVANISTRPELRPPHGIGPLKDGPGIWRISKSTSVKSMLFKHQRFVRSAVTIISYARFLWHKANFAAPRVKRVRCVSVEEAGRTDVYCLTVPTTGCFAIEGGLIVSNCGDMARYACLSRPWIRAIPKTLLPPRDSYRPAQEERNDADSILLL